MYYNVYNKYRKFKKLKYYIFLKTLNLSIVHSKCGQEYEKIKIKKKNHPKY